MYFQTKNFEFSEHFLTLNKFSVYQQIVMILFLFKMCSNFLGIESTLTKIVKNILGHYFF